MLKTGHNSELETYLMTVTRKEVGSSLPQINFPASLNRTSVIRIEYSEEEEVEEEEATEEEEEEKKYLGSFQLECFSPLTPMILTSPLDRPILVHGGG